MVHEIKAVAKGVFTGKSAFPAYCGPLSVPFPKLLLIPTGMGYNGRGRDLLGDSEGRTSNDTIDRNS